MPAVWQLSWSLPEAFQPDFEGILNPFCDPFWYNFATSRCLTKTYYLLHFSHFLASQNESKINNLRTPFPQPIWEPLRSTFWVRVGSLWANFGVPWSPGSSRQDSGGGCEIKSFERFAI